MASTAPEQDQDVQATDNQLRLFFERIERLEEEKKGIADDVKDTFAKPRRWVMMPRSCGKFCVCGR